MIENKLIELGITVSNEKFHNEAQILHEYEELIGHSIPETYKYFILKYKTSLIFDNIIIYRPLQSSPWGDEKGMQQLDEFYGLCQSKGEDLGLSTLSSVFETYLSRMPYSVVPIASAPGGNQICLGIIEEVENKVFFWDHEDEREIVGENQNDFKNMYLIADTFEDFIDSLMIDKSDPGSDDGIVSSWFSDDLDL
ncbi:SMI1/KNR4 family protein [uncultured Gimesia sp.]|uniref:SMI1/KNR4 family protein n=1 Tax=uncultured Gimesia sp. TaxID=1678688 RepID=UPI00261C9799|nr:SMI1/KNR4 family protein [uncultured Gimesia sp.]